MHNISLEVILALLIGFIAGALFCWIVIRANLYKINFKTLRNFNAYFFQAFIYFFIKNNPTVFGWTNKMVQKH